jgi:hypothetical protein
MHTDLHSARICDVLQVMHHSYIRTDVTTYKPVAPCIPLMAFDVHN